MSPYVQSNASTSRSHTKAFASQFFGNTCALVFLSDYCFDEYLASSLSKIIKVGEKYNNSSSGKAEEQEEVTY